MPSTNVFPAHQDGPKYKSLPRKRHRNTPSMASVQEWGSRLLANICKNSANTRFFIFFGFSDLTTDDVDDVGSEVEQGDWTGLDGDI